MPKLPLASPSRELDSDRSPYHHFNMPSRTVAIDEDVSRLVQSVAERTHLPFAEVVNNTLRAGLAIPPQKTEEPPFYVDARPMGLREGIDSRKMNQLADDLEIEEYLTKFPPK